MKVVQYRPFTFADIFEDSFKASQSMISNVSQTDDKVRLSMDVPGIPLSALNVEAETDGTIHVTGKRKSVSSNGNYGSYRQVKKMFKFDPETSDLANVQASLAADGVLTLSIPKKSKAEPTKIPIVTAGDINIKNSDENWSLSMDVPGVKAKDLQVSVEENGTVNLSGKRKVVSHDQKVVKQYKIHKHFLMDSDTTEISKMKAYMEDGVVTLVAPKKPKTEPRKISVVVSSNETEALPSSEPNESLDLSNGPDHEDKTEDPEESAKEEEKDSTKEDKVEETKE